MVKSKLGDNIEELLSAAQANSSTRAKIRREFPSWGKPKQRKFIDSLQWGIVKDLAKNNYETSY
jgi:hypothetical protein